MADRNRTNLGRDAWLKKIRDLAVHCPACDASRASDRVRDLNQLIGLAPDLSLLDGLRAVSDASLEALLDNGGADAAALSFFRERSGYLLSRSGEGLVIATVALPGNSRERSAPGATPALALVGALARALANVMAATQVSARLAGAAAHPRLVAVPALH